MNGCKSESSHSKRQQKISDAPRAGEEKITRETIPLRINVNIRTVKPRLSEPLFVEVTLTNRSDYPVLMNRRLAVGYLESQARELFVEVFLPESNQNVAIPAQLYQRDFSGPGDYGKLRPGEEVRTTFDLLEWYTIVTPGKYELVVYYQADEPGASPPPGLLKGTWNSLRIAFEIYP